MDNYSNFFLHFSGKYYSFPAVYSKSFQNFISNLVNVLCRCSRGLQSRFYKTYGIKAMPSCLTAPPTGQELRFLGLSCLKRVRRWHSPLTLKKKSKKNLMICSILLQQTAFSSSREFYLILPHDPISLSSFILSLGSRRTVSVHLLHN